MPGKSGRSIEKEKDCKKITLEEILYFFKAYFLDLRKRCLCLYKDNSNMRFPA